MTTLHLQKKPDYFSSISECKNARKINIISNSRYPDFKQSHFTAGDTDQFQEYNDKTNGNHCAPTITLGKNKFHTVDLSKDIVWDKYKNIGPESVTDTFNYMFNKFKKGVFIKIQDNKVKVFLPFSKKGFINEWSDSIKIDPKYKNISDFLFHINKMIGKEYYKISVNDIPSTWYANNCLVRTEFPINEGDTNTSQMSDMFKELCANRKVPDLEFFINRRDFPLIKKNSTEAYDHMFGDNTPLVSHNYEKYSPILSMVTTDEHSDIPIPTGDDWSRISSYEGKFFEECRTYPTSEDFNIKWSDKKPTAVFRGASTGCGVKVDTNVRLKLAYISATTPGELLDAGISKWQVRPRKLKTEKYLQTIDVVEMNKLGITIVPVLSPLQQSAYKYIVHVDGHVSAFRLSLEMTMGCCILLVDSKYRMWFKSLLKPMIHYIPIKEDLSDLVERIQWCRENDATCETIANNAREFYTMYLQKDGALDYLQKIMVELKQQTGVYLYNVITPLDIQIEGEKKLDLYSPETDKTISAISTIPKQGRSFGLLQGMQLIVNMINTEKVFSDVAKKSELIFTNKTKTVSVHKYTLAGFSFIVKSSTEASKQKENIHESYIATKELNEIIKSIPNFAYVFGKFDGEVKNNVIMEYIHGDTFDKWLKSDKFNMKEYLFILIQLSMVLQVSQLHCGFVHYDLTPWNIVIQEIDTPVSFDYMIDSKNIFRVTTRLIPVIIDYGKSHVIHKNEHHGYINMYTMSTIQDIISLLVTSLSVITQFSLSQKNTNDVISLINFLSNTKYRETPFTKLGEVKFFLTRAKKYTEMISSKKYELEKLTPLDFITYITSKFNYDFKYERIAIPLFRINRGNPIQVFDYILSSTTIEKEKSFITVFEKVLEYDFSTTNNIFLSYYSLQLLEENISSVHVLLLKYLGTTTPNTVYNKCMAFLKNNYIELTKRKNTEIDFTSKYSINLLPKIQYTEDTFLSPTKILGLLQNFSSDNYMNDLSDYKIAFEKVLVNNGIFKMTDEDKKYYTIKFNHLLTLNTVEYKTRIADMHTLYSVSDKVYTNNASSLLGAKLNCKSIEKYLSVYDSIRKFLKSKNKIKE